MTTKRETLVSIVIIFWNEADYLRQAVDSVLAQTCTDWELILVDDGSTDESLDIATSYVSGDPNRIIVARHDGGANRGMSASRNLGLSQARGEWITFLDGDDVWEPDKLQRQLALLAAHSGVDVLASPALWWYDSPSGPADFVQTLRPPPDSVVDGGELVEGFLRDEWASLCDLVIRRELVNSVGGYEAQFEAMFEDQVFHTKLLLGREVLVTGRWWYRYRQHDKTSTAHAHAQGLHRQARIKFLRWLFRYSLSRPEVSPGLKTEIFLKFLALRLRLGAIRRVVTRRLPGCQER